MSERCENCGNSVLATDTVCWHCGRPLPKKSLPKPSPTKRLRAFAPSSVRLATDEEAAVPRTYDFRAIAIYSLLTLLILILLVLTMHSLGRRPLLVAGAELRLGTDWTAVTDNDLNYTLSLPPGWQWLDSTFRQQQTLLDETAAAEPNIAWSLSPLGAGVDDLELLAMAFPLQPADDPDNPQPLTFVVIGRSQQLATLAPPQALASLSKQPIVTTASATAEPFPGQPQARFSLLSDSRQIQCRSLHTAATGTAYLVAACAPQSSFGRIQRDLDNILDSFQLLQH